MNLNNISILENSLYTTPTEREELVNDKERVAKLFVTTFLGFIAMYGSGKVKTSLASYLRGEQKVTLRNIGDDNNDLSLVIKLALESGVIRIQQAREMTKLVYLLKKLSIDTVDEVAILNLMSPNIKIIKELDGRFRSQYNRYLSSEISIYEFIYSLRAQIRADESLSTEFKDIFIKYLPMLKKKAGVTDDDSPITAQIDTADLAKLTPEDIEATKAAEDKVKVAAVAPTYDLTNSASLNDAFIEAVKSPNPSRFMKTLGTTLNNFPWADVRLNDDSYFAWYEARANTQIKDHYITRINVQPWPRRSSYRDSLKNSLKSGTMYLYGLVVALKRGLDKVEFVEKVIELWKEDAGHFPNGIIAAFKEVQQLSGDSSFNIFLELLDKGFGDIPDLGIEPLEFVILPDNRQPNSFIPEYLIDNFERFNTKERETITKYVLVKKLSSRFMSRTLFLDSYNKQRFKYNDLLTSRDLISSEFGDAWMKLYNKLEDNDFYGSSFLREFEIQELGDLDNSASPAKVYEHYKGQPIQSISEDNFKKIMSYVQVNGLQTDWLKSLAAFDYIDSVKITKDGISPDSISLSKHLNIISSARDLSTEEYEFIALTIAEYVIEKNNKTIFIASSIKSIRTILNAIRALFVHGMPSGIYSEYNRLMPKSQNMFNKLSDKYGTLTIEVSMDDDSWSPYNVLMGRLNDEIFSGLNIKSRPADGFTTESLIDAIVKTGPEQVLYGRFALNSAASAGITNLTELNTYTDDMSDDQDRIFGPNFKTNLVRGVLKGLLKLKDTEFKLRDTARYYSKFIRNVSYLPSSDNDLIEEFVDYIDGLVLEASTNMRSIKKDPGVNAMLLERGILKVEDLSDDEATGLLSITQNFSTEMGEKLVAKVLENPDFINVMIKKLRVSSSVRDLVTLVQKRGTAKQFKDLQDAILLNTVMFIDIDDDDPYLNESVITGLLEVSTTEYKEEITKNVLNKISKLNPKQLSRLFRSSKNVLVSILYNSTDEIFNEFIESDIPQARKREIGMMYIARKIIVDTNIRSSLFNPEDPIKPMMDLSDERLQQVLEFNNIKINAKNTRKRQAETYTEYLERNARDSIDEFEIGKTKVELEEVSEEMMNRRTVEYNRMHANNKHGDIALKFIRSLSVSPELTKPAYFDFKNEHSNSVMFPVFHGTGSVAASFINRFGFAIIDASDESAVGRMLGNGIYFSNILDKSAQYVGDYGYSRGKGNRGYLLELEAVLGVNGVDYKEAGTTGSDNIVSPEWVVYDPGKQLSLKKTHEVVTVSKEHIKTLESQLTESTGDYASKSITPLKGFFEWIKPIKESLEVDDVRYSSTFIFQDGTVPTKDGVKSWRSVSLDLDNVKMQSSAMGIAITVYYDDANIPLEDVYIINNTSIFTQENGLEYRILNAFLNNETLDFND